MTRARSLTWTFACIVMCATPSTAQDPATFAVADRPGTVREIRMGLVCYGGISLAIYMHGNTKEFHRLALASRALDQDAGKGLTASDAERGAAGKDLPDTAGYYYDLLRRQWASEGVRTRIVIDVVSGTSAGGINGVILAKALASDLSQDALRELWFTKAGIGKLLAWPPLFRYPPLKGDAIYLWVREALDAMEKTAPQRPAYSTGTLMPPDQALDLFVTTTDLGGHPQHVLIGDPATILEKRHREVMHFRFDGKPDPERRRAGFESYWNPALAFAARATSSFPGAFPPFNLDTVAKHERRRDEVGADGIASALFRDYELEERQPDDDWARKTYFMDGGVIDNYPFGHAVRAIVSRTSDHEVRRVLVYLQPDPGRPPAAPQGKRPKWLPTIWAGLASVNGHEPILDDLLEVQAHNDRVGRLRNIVREEEARGRDESTATRSLPATGSSSVAHKVAPFLENAKAFAEGRKLDGGAPRPVAEDIERFRALRRRIEGEAAAEAALLHRGYTELRVYSVIEQIADVIDKRCRFPKESAQSTIVREVVHLWAAKKRLIGEETLATVQDAFLEDLDLGYLRRQLRFVSDWLNAQYPGSAGTPSSQRPSAADLDTAKGILAKQIQLLTGLIRGDGGEAAASPQTDPIEALFCSVDPWQDTAFDQQAAKILAEKERDFDAWRTSSGAVLRGAQDGIRLELLDAFYRITQAWHPDTQQEVLTRYMGFPYWDRLLYPFTAFSGIGELREIEVYRVSPDDATTLQAGNAAAKLKGVSVGHFGAFFHRSSRENDYVWGRLDAIERISQLLTARGDDLPTPDRAELKKGFLAALEEDSNSGLVDAKRIEDFRRLVGGL